eukprot:scaffold684_cov345-Pavlova_lutheri.AAC.86
MTSTSWRRSTSAARRARIEARTSTDLPAPNPAAQRIGKTTPQRSPSVVGTCARASRTDRSVPHEFGDSDSLPYS